MSVVLEEDTRFKIKMFQVLVEVETMARMNKSVSVK